MKRALLLFDRASVEDGKADPAALVALLNGAGKDLQAAACMTDELLFNVSRQDISVIDTLNDCPLTDYDVIYFRYCGREQALAMAAARFCALKHIPFVDREAMQLGSRAKVNQYINLHEIGAPFPASLIGSLPVLAREYAAHGFSFPFILKASKGSRGQDNFLVKDDAALQSIVNAQPDAIFVLQTFIPNNGDWRVLVMGDQVKMIIGRTATGDTHLNNTSQGGQAEALPLDALPAEVLAQCVQAAQFYGRDIAGVDVMRSTEDGQYYFLEVNRAPQIEHASFEAAKAAHLADYLVELAA